VEKKEKGLSKGAIVGFIIIGLSLILTIILVLVLNSGKKVDVEAKGFLEVSLDDSKSFLILATEKASNLYKDAILEIKKLHPDTGFETFSPDDLPVAEEKLKKFNPYYVQLVILPEELDVNFNWRWLKMIARLDKDPFVDTRTGFITGKSPEDAFNFVQRISKAVSGELKLPAKMVDNLGPNPQMGANFFNNFKGSFFVPVLENKMGIESISHGNKGYKNEWLKMMNDAGIVHFGGHGYPDRIENGLNVSQVSQVELAPCVIFSGVCYTGVVGKYFEMFTSGDKVSAKKIEPPESFCLQLLTNNVIGYLAALHPDHGIPVYQEMEHMALKGASLGEAIKYTYDGVVLGNGGKMPDFEVLLDGDKSPHWTPTDVMLKGTASRILFGDPSLKIMNSLDAPKLLKYTVERRGNKLIVGAIMNNTNYKAIFTDTYHDYLAYMKNKFNDRAVFYLELPESFENPSSVKVLGAANGPDKIKYKLQGWEVERTEEKKFIHVQVDFATTEYMQSEWRNKGAAVGIAISQ